jgi:pyrroline-5-carboxylate reductase
VSQSLAGAGPLWLVGAGNMGGAMLRGWLAGGLDPTTVTVIDPAGPTMPAGVRVLPAPPPDGEEPATLVLAVKPQLLDAAASALAPLLVPETLILSILAGVEIGSLRARFGTPRGIIRAMPNTPASIRKGVTALYPSGADQGQCDRAKALMAALGSIEWLDREDLFDAVTALSGSGPAFVFRFAEALAAAGASVGLDPAQAERLARATVAGAAALLDDSDETAGVLADRVASPGGTTRAGLDVLDDGEALRDLLARTLDAAKRRGAELAAAARS